MILTRLVDLYQRLLADPDSAVAEPGFAPEKASFALVLRPDGTLADPPVRDLRDTSGKTAKPRTVVVPSLGEKKGAGIKANFLWDAARYVLGAIPEDDNEVRTAKCREAFATFNTDVTGDVEDEGVRAVLAFVRDFDPSTAKDLPHWPELGQGNLVFMIEGQDGFIHGRRAARSIWAARMAPKRDAQFTSTCLVTGKKCSPAALHGAIKGVRGAQTAGASLVSYNAPAFCSYGKKQNLNAPVSPEAARAYTTALNYLLSQGSRRKVGFGETMTLVFWTGKPSPSEDIYAALFGVQMEDGDEAQDQQLASRVESTLQALVRGRPAPEMGDPATPFYLLGLAPNAARLAVQLWQESTVGEVARHVAGHHADMELDKCFEAEPERYAPFQLLKALAVRGEEKNIPAHFSEPLLRAVTMGGQYPLALLPLTLGRLRAEGFYPDREKAYEGRTRARVALIKAVLRRLPQCNNKEGLTVSLDETCRDPGYLLGRLFAALEHVQRDALGQLNASIADRFYGAASSTPATVFPQLLARLRHHLGKLDEKPGLRVIRENLVQEILDAMPGGCPGFPRHLDLPGQGRFAIGYYHQRKVFFTKKDALQPAEETQA